MRDVWFSKRNRPTTEELAPRDDIDEAVAIREEARTGLVDLRKQAPAVRMMTDILINRAGKNHYIELLYQHVPGANS